MQLAVSKAHQMHIDARDVFPQRLLLGHLIAIERRKVHASSVFSVTRPEGEIPVLDPRAA